MSSAIALLVFLIIYGLIGYAVYKILRKLSKYLASRILLPTSDIELYLKEINTTKEEKVRRQWLISFVILNIISIIFSYLSRAAFSPYLSGMSTVIFNAVALAISVLSVIPSILITYYCAYQKRGSAFLLYIIIILPLSIFGLMTREYFRPSMIWSQALVIASFSQLAINIVYWINCIRLRSVNLKRRFHTNALILKEKFKAL